MPSKTSPFACAAIAVAATFLALPTHAQVSWATLFGGTGDEGTYAVAHDATGHVFVAGHTQSTAFPPVSPGVFSWVSGGGGGWNAFVCKFDPAQSSGNQLVWSTIIAGPGDDQIFGLALDQGGNVIVTGRTTSASFITLAGYDATPNGSGDAFVLEFSTNGLLLYGTMLGGLGDDAGLEVHASQGGLITVAGFTQSPNFPTMNPFQPTLSGARDAFVARIDPSAGQNGLIYGTYLGGSGDETEGIPSPPADISKALGLDVDALGLVTVAGVTSSVDFPTRAADFQPLALGAWDGFVVTIDPTAVGLAQLAFGTYLGGSSYEAILDLDVTPVGRIVVVGYTYSGDFPVTPGAYDTALGGTPHIENDMIVTMLDPSVAGPAQLAYSTYLGGSQFESIGTVAADPSGAIVFGGWTRSPGFQTTPGTLPGMGSPPTTGPVGVLGRINPAGGGACDAEFLALIGGSTAQQVTSIAIDPSLRVTIAGMTVSPDFPTTPSAYQAVHAGGGRDAWIASVDLLPSGVWRHGTGTPSSGGPVAFIGGAAVPGYGCFSLICRQAPAAAVGALGLTLDAATNPSTALTTPLLANGAAIWLDVAHPTFTVADVTSDALGGCVIPIPLTGFATPPGLEVVVQFGWVHPTSGDLSTSGALRVVF